MLVNSARNTHQSLPKNFKEADFIFLVSIMIIDGSDNVDYFIYKFNLSKKDQKRLRLIESFYKNKNDKKKSFENNLNKIFYFNGRQAVIDIIRG